MGSIQPLDIQELYEGFSLPLSKIDCGEKCGPYNNYGVPICCDIQLVVPSAYNFEWDYLQSKTNLWHLWSGTNHEEIQELQSNLQPDQTLLQCLGYKKCQRSYRTLTCRAFPFYPYLDSAGNFLGLAPYLEYKDKCWMISHLELVDYDYKIQFQQTFDKLFHLNPDIMDYYLNYCGYIRNQALSVNETVMLLDFSGGVCLVDPRNEGISPIEYKDLPAYGPFGISKDLIFPDEIDLT